jgi:carbon-monoxide dehydrogenase small subunit
MEKRIEFILNGKKTECIVPCNMTLLDMLRTKFRMISVKKGCDSGDCGSCTVIVNNEPICSCLMLAVQADGKDVLTLEGVTSGGKLHPVQRAFMENHGMQCGFCTPGFIITTYSLLNKNPTPTIEEIREALEGNLCRCTGYAQIIESVMKASKLMSMKV